MKNRRAFLKEMAASDLVDLCFRPRSLCSSGVQSGRRQSKGQATKAPYSLEQRREWHAAARLRRR